MHFRFRFSRFQLLVHSCPCFRYIGLLEPSGRDLEHFLRWTYFLRAADTPLRAASASQSRLLRQPPFLLFIGGLLRQIGHLTHHLSSLFHPSRQRRSWRRFWRLCLDNFTRRDPAELKIEALISSSRSFSMDSFYLFVLFSLNMCE